MSRLKLPKQILDAIGEDEGGRRPLGRKERRKKERELKTRGPSLKNGKHRGSEQRSQNERRPVQNVKRKVEGTVDESSEDAPEFEAESELESEAEQTDTEILKDDDLPKPVLSRGLKNKLAEDDKEIATLEKKLGVKKGRSKADDGLEDLLEGLDGEDSDQNKRKRKREEEREWLDRKRQKPRKEEGKTLDDQEESVLGDSDASSFEGFDSGPRPTPPIQKVRENPYVPPPTGMSTLKYVPPSRRGPASSEEEEALSRLRRQIQGLLNRLSEANLLSILGDVERIYQQTPRGHVTSIVIDLLMGLICDRASLNDTFLILHAGFIAALYKVIGIDFGAVVTQRLVEEFDQYYTKEYDGSGSKEAANLMSLLAELYKFQIVGSQLMFDYIRLFLSTISETHTELLLRIIKNSGSQLRQDDPSALKDIVLLLRPAIATTGEENLSVRTKFMIETINDLKNNRIKAGAASSALTSESSVRMKKILGTLNSRSLRATEPLRIGLADLQNQDKKGKWWLVGSSWKGEQSVQKANTTDNEPVKDGATADLMQLAKEQRMNTDVRRAIFVTLLSASDHHDAYLRLKKLHLKKSQEPEICRVVLHCAGAETSYNPYYTLIARKLCGEHKLKMGFQFGLWDLFKRMGERDEEEDILEEENEQEEDRQLGLRGVVNYAKFYATLVAEGALGLGVLKKLRPMLLQPKTKTFLELFLVTVLLQCDGSSNSTVPVEAIFEGIKEHSALARELQVFLRNTVSHTDLVQKKTQQALLRHNSKKAIQVLSEADLADGTDSE